MRMVPPPPLLGAFPRCAADFFRRDANTRLRTAAVAAAEAAASASFSVASKLSFEASMRSPAWALGGRRIVPLFGLVISFFFGLLLVAVVVLVARVLALARLRAGFLLAFRDRAEAPFRRQSLLRLLDALDQARLGLEMRDVLVLLVLMLLPLLVRRALRRERVARRRLPLGGRALRRLELRFQRRDLAILRSIISVLRFAAVSLRFRFVPAVLFSMVVVPLVVVLRLRHLVFGLARPPVRALPLLVPRHVADVKPPPRGPVLLLGPVLGEPLALVGLAMVHVAIMKPARTLR